jgi:hypothetical protein
MKETKTAYILASIRTKGFVEAKNINQLALKLDIKPENLRHIIDSIVVANAVQEQTKHNHQDYYFEKFFSGKKKKGAVILGYKWVDEAKTIPSEKVKEVALKGMQKFLGVK